MAVLFLAYPILVHIIEAVIPLLLLSFTMAFGAGTSSIPTGPVLRGPEKLICSEGDVVTFHLTHERDLPLFANPLASEAERKQHEEEESESVLKHGDDQSSQWLSYADLSKGDPPLKRPHESSTVQLFYDLFFVANLTTFTNVHEINDKNTLKSYIGFFSMLWFTWLQVSLFDVRFGTDSVFERICQALQFGIMAGFAVVGPGYHIGWSAEDKGAEQALLAFKTLSLIVMISRLVLAVQYGVVMWWLRGYRKVILPMALHILVLFTMAAVFTGLFFTFTVHSGESSMLAWYVAIGFETAIILLVSGRYRFLSFRRTYIYERLGLLTLIILGEGIIGLCSSIQKVGSDLHFGSDIVGMIIAGIVIIYCLWMLYFDQLETKRVGTLRQQLWIMTHFPFHVAILLTVEGVSQLCVWRKWTDLVRALTEKLTPLAHQDYAQESAYLTGVMADFFQPFQENSGQRKLTPPDLTEHLASLTAAKDSDEAWEAKSSIVAHALNFAAESFGIEPPEHSKETAENEEEVVNSLMNETFSTIFLYFFIAAGAVLILASVMFLLGKRHKIRADYINLVVRSLAGLGLCLLVTMGLSHDDKVVNTINAFAWSAWVLPTVAITYAVGMSCPSQ